MAALAVWVKLVSPSPWLVCQFFHVELWTASFYGATLTLLVRKMRTGTALRESRWLAAWEDYWMPQIQQALLLFSGVFFVLGWRRGWNVSPWLLQSKANNSWYQLDSANAKCWFWKMTITGTEILITIKWTLLYCFTHHHIVIIVYRWACQVK